MKWMKQDDNLVTHISAYDFVSASKGTIWTDQVPADKEKAMWQCGIKNEVFPYYHTFWDAQKIVETEIENRKRKAYLKKYGQEKYDMKHNTN